MKTVLCERAIEKSVPKATKTAESGAVRSKGARGGKARGGRKS
jgi:hypothetical protein